MPKLVGVWRTPWYGEKLPLPRKGVKLAFPGMKQNYHSPEKE